MRLPSAYVLSHLGLGDHVGMIGCLHFLANFYEDVYFVCIDRYCEQLEFAFKDFPFIHMVPFQEQHGMQNINKAVKDVIQPHYETSDIFISGVHCEHLQTKITHPQLLNPSELCLREIYQNLLPLIGKKYNYRYQGKQLLPHQFDFFDMFYRHMGLNTQIMFDFFLVSGDESFKSLYDEIAKYRLVFVNSSCGTVDGIFDFSRAIDPILKDDNYLVVCSNHNYYDKENPKYDIVQKYICLPTIFHYIEILKNAEILYLTDSSIACMTLPLIKTGQMKTKNVFIVQRNTLKMVDINILL
jgi:hypothetical protein